MLKVFAVLAKFPASGKSSSIRVQEMNMAPANGWRLPCYFNTSQWHAFCS